VRAVCLLACLVCLTALGAALSPFPNAPSGGDWHTVHDVEWTQEAVMVGWTPSTPEAAPHYGESWYLPDNGSGLLVDVWNTMKGKPELTVPSWSQLPSKSRSAQETPPVAKENP
jgi:hypothetical protein